MVRLTSVYGSFRAHVLAARLHYEGFDVELRGAIDSVYAVTVGEMARIDLYVPDDQADDASLVLLVDEVDETLDLDRMPGRHLIAPWAVVTAAFGVVALAAVEMFS